MKDVESDGGQHRAPRRNGYYRYYLEDHPILGPLVILLLGGLCLYSAIFSNLLRDVMLPENADRSLVDQFYTAIGWGVGFVIAAMLIALVFLITNFVSAGFRRLRRRRPAVCPRCGLSEVRGQLKFARRQVEDTGWELVTCSRCGQEWHERI